MLGAHDEQPPVPIWRLPLTAPISFGIENSEKPPAMPLATASRPRAIQPKTRPTRRRVGRLGGGGCRYRRIGSRTLGGRTARPFPLAAAVRPNPLLIVVRTGRPTTIPRCQAGATQPDGGPRKIA